MNIVYISQVRFDNLIQYQIIVLFFIQPYDLYENVNAFYTVLKDSSLWNIYTLVKVKLITKHYTQDRNFARRKLPIR